MSAQVADAKVKSILIVEDDQAIRDVLEFALGAEGFNIVTASNGREGIRALKSMKPPSLILLDLMMPVMNGWEFAEEISKDPALSTIPVVVITAFSEKALLPPVAKQVIKKPLDIEFLLKTVSEYCA